jgi:hypothetical protein
MRFMDEITVPSASTASSPSTADLRRAARAEVHRIEQALLLGLLLHDLERHAGLERQGAVHRVHGLDATHALERQADLAGARDAAAHEPRQAAHDHDGLARRVAGRERA